MPQIQHRQLLFYCWILNCFPLCYQLIQIAYILILECPLFSQHILAVAVKLQLFVVCAFPTILPIMTIVVLFLYARHVGYYAGKDRGLKHDYLRSIFISAKDKLFDLKLFFVAPTYFLAAYLDYCVVFFFPGKFGPEALAPKIPVEYNVQGDDYGSFHDKLEKSLSPDYSGYLEQRGGRLMIKKKREEEEEEEEEDAVKRIPFLSEQRKGKQPSKWIFISMVGNDTNDKTTIAVRNDNLYLVAFSNKYEEWFLFKNMTSEFPRTVRTSELPFGGAYCDLIDGGYSNLKNYAMNKTSTLAAVELLARHKERKSERDEAYNGELKDALTTVIFVVAEAARWSGIHDPLLQRWQDAATTNVSKEQAQTVVIWGSTSYALFKSAESAGGNMKSWPPSLKKRHTRDLKRCNIKCPADAVGHPKLLLLPQGSCLTDAEGVSNNINKH